MSTSWDLSQWLFALENRHKQEIQLGLTRIKNVAEKLNLLQPKAQVITVAGTNGKGSTVEALLSLYRVAGYQVGAYTSPHLLHFNERIRVNGQAIPENRLIQAFSKIEEARGQVHLTYFETTTLAALLYFQQFPLDIIILEVGIGGRLDATNIIDADLAIITTIDFDHQDYLGDTLDKIGQEKAGILRPGKPLIYADSHLPQSIKTTAESLNCPMFMNGQQYQYQMTQEKLTFSFQEKTIEIATPRLHGNAIAAALMASHCLESTLPVSRAQTSAGLAGISLAGRLQLFQTAERLVLVDVSHNAQSAQRLADYLNEHFPDKCIHAVFSALADKDIPAIIAPLKQCVSHWYPALLPGKRASSREYLGEIFEAHAIESFLCHNSPLAAYQSACNQSGPNDLIVVYGSFLTVGDVLPALMSARPEASELK